MTTRRKGRTASPRIFYRTAGHLPLPGHTCFVVVPGLLAALLLLIVLLAVGLFWRRRENQLRALAREWGATFHPQGSSDTELRLTINPEGTSKLEAGAEHEPLFWRDLECFPLFDPRTHASRLLSHLIESKSGAGRVIVFDYQFIETDGAITPSDEPAIRRDVTVIYQEQDGLRLDGLKKEMSGQSSIAYRDNRLISVGEVKRLLGQ